MMRYRCILLIQAGSCTQRESKFDYQPVTQVVRPLPQNVMNDFDPRVKLRSMFPTKPGKYNFSDNDAISMMVFTRTLIEKSMTADKYPILNLYCNWTLHPELEGSMPAYKILAATTDILLCTTDPDQRAVQISQELSSAELRQEIIRLYTPNRIPTHIFKSAATWMMFGRHFFKAILGKRLRYPPNPASHPKASSIYNTMVQKAGTRLNDAALTLRLQSDHETEDNLIYWVVECFDGHVEKGLYKNLERDPDFSNPSFWSGKVAFVRQATDDSSAV